MYDSDDFWMFRYVAVVCFQHLLVTLLLAFFDDWEHSHMLSASPLTVTHAIDMSSRSMMHHMVRWFADVGLITYDDRWVCVSQRCLSYRPHQQRPYHGFQCKQS